MQPYYGLSLLLLKNLNSGRRTESERKPKPLFTASFHRTQTEGCTKGLAKIRISVHKKAYSCCKLVFLWGIHVLFHWIKRLHEQQSILHCWLRFALSFRSISYNQGQIGGGCGHAFPPNQHYFWSIQFKIFPFLWTFLMTVILTP